MVVFEFEELVFITNSDTFFLGLVAYGRSTGDSIPVFLHVVVGRAGLVRPIMIPLEILDRIHARTQILAHIFFVHEQTNGALAVGGHIDSLCPIRCNRIRSCFAVERPSHVCVMRDIIRAPFLVDIDPVSFRRHVRCAWVCLGVLGCLRFSSTIKKKTRDMGFLLIVIILSAAVVLSFVYSHFNQKYYQTLHVIFFMTFVVSMYSFYVQDKQNESDQNMKYISLILQDLYEAQRHPHDALRVALLLEKVSLFDPKLVDDNQLGPRLRPLVHSVAFQKYWHKEASTYPETLRSLVSSLVHT